MPIRSTYLDTKKHLYYYHYFTIMTWLIDIWKVSEVVKCKDIQFDMEKVPYWSLMESNNQENINISIYLTNTQTHAYM